jgi:hypothetical protein
MKKDSCDMDEGSKKENAQLLSQLRELEKENGKLRIQVNIFFLAKMAQLILF